MAGWKAPRISPWWPGAGNFKVTGFLNVLPLQSSSSLSDVNRSPTGWFSYALFPFSCAHLINSMPIWFYQKNQQAAWKNILLAVPFTWLEFWALKTRKYWKIQQWLICIRHLVILGASPQKNLYISGYLLKFQTK